MKASRASSLRRLGSESGKSAIAGMPSAVASSAAATMLSIDKRSTPGIEVTGMRLFVPSMTNNGQIRSSTLKRCSAISRRDHLLRRFRRIRMFGKAGCVAGGCLGLNVLRSWFAVRIRCAGLRAFMTSRFPDQVVLYTRRNQRLLARAVPRMLPNRVSRKSFCIFFWPCPRGNGCGGPCWPLGPVSYRRFGTRPRALHARIAR